MNEEGGGRKEAGRMDGMGQENMRSKK